MMTSAEEAYYQGGIIAYPTEAVFGLGCDPDNSQAIEKLLSIKKRSPEKGLILLAANYAQLLPYIDDSKIQQDQRVTILSRWPDGITQLVPKNIHINELLKSTAFMEINNFELLIKLLRITCLIFC